MSDGTETLDLNTPDIPASGEVENNSHATQDQAHEEVRDLEALEPEGHTEEPEAEAPEPEEEFIEVERNGKKYKIPKDLEPELLMQSDYTRKTQTVAEERKALEAEKQAIAQQAERIKALDGDYRKLAVIDDYLERGSKVNWAEVIRNDPIEGPAKYAEYQHWQNQRNTLSQQIEAQESEALEAQRREVAKRIEEGRQVLQREIKGWNADTAKKVAEFGISNGLTPQEVSSIHDPRFVKILHQAWLGSQLLQKQQAAPKPAATPAPETIKPLAPVATRGASPTARKPLSQMSMEEYVAARKAGRAT